MDIIYTYYPLFVRYNHGLAVLKSLYDGLIIPMGDGFIEKVKDYNPDYVCMSFVTKHDYKASEPYIEALRRLGIPLLGGGVYARHGGYMEGFDYICRGEGEVLSDFFNNGDTSVFDMKYYCNDINIMPSYSEVTGYEFDRGIPMLQGLKVMPYSSSRGCPFQCSFCEIRFQPKGVRIKNTIKQDLEYLKTLNPDIIMFLDELLPYYSEEWKLQIEGNTIPFMAYIRADINKQDLFFLYENGLKFCAFGIESGDEKYRNEILQKGLLDKEIERTVRILKELNIGFIPFFMTNTPGETKEIKTKTMDFFNTLGGVVWEYERIGG